MSIRICNTVDTVLLARLNHDVQEIHNEIEPEIFKPHSEENMKMLFDTALSDENVSAYIAFYEDVAAGYMLLSKRSFDEDFFKKSYSVVFIEQICVDGIYKGKGIGKALVDFAKEYAKEQKVNRIEMDYWTGNKNSGEFFRSQGFSTFNERMCIKL